MTEHEFFQKKRSRAEVAEFFGVSDRDARRIIAALQENFPIINLQDGKGYFLAEGDELKRYALQEYKRAVKVMRKARRLLKWANVDENQIEWSVFDENN